MKRSASDQPDRSVKLYEVLLEEYEKLQLIHPAEANRIKGELFAKYSGLDWHDFKMNDWIQAKRVKFIRQEIVKHLALKHGKNLTPSALCFSGGGIRSATFSLGVLQALAKYSLLDKFDYLSTVSGGGYIGSWFSAWIDRAGSVEKVQASLCRDQTNPFLFELKDLEIDLDNIFASFKRFESMPIALDPVAANALLEDDRKLIESFYQWVNFLALQDPDEPGKIVPENHILRIELKAFCKALNRSILSCRAVKEVQTQELCQKMTTDSLKSVSQRRDDLERAVAPLLRVPARFARTDLTTELTLDALKTYAEESSDEIEELGAEEKLLRLELQTLADARNSETSQTKRIHLRERETIKQNVLKDIRKQIGKLEKRVQYVNSLIVELDDPGKASVPEDFTGRFLRIINNRIEANRDPIEQLKVRKLVRDNLPKFIAPYLESDLLQNESTANTAPEPEEVTHLRTYSNYMSPKLGLFSTDSFGLFTLYLRNLLLNWLVFVPLIAAALLLPKMYLWLFEQRGINAPFGISESNSITGWARSIPLKTIYLPIELAVFLFLLIVTAVAGVVLINKFRPSLGEDSIFKQNYGYDNIGGITTVGKKVVILCFLPLTAVAFAIPLFWLWLSSEPDVPRYDLRDFVTFGLVLFVGGFVFARIIFAVNRRNRRRALGADAVRPYTRNDLWHILFEFGISFICGAFGGAALHFGAERLPEIMKYSSAILKTNVDAKIYAALSPAIFLTAFLLAATLFVGIASKITDDMDREWMNRFGAMVAKMIIAWIGIATVVLLGDTLLIKLGPKGWTTQLLTSIGGISGALTLILGFSSKSTEEKKESGSSSKNMIFAVLPQIAAPVFLVFLIGLIAWLTTQIMVYSNLENPWLWFFILAAIGALAGFVININKFSLHAMYRERLIRTYLGASRLKERFKTANSFTDLDTRDNVEMKYLFQKPYHVLNMTLNLVKAKNLRWQNRKAESFTSSALYCGSSNMGNGTGHFRSSEKYASNPQNERSITLGTSMAVSGAAASPNMGYFTVSTSVSFLMTLFNIRLGWWFGNPGKQGDKTYMRASPDWSPRLLAAEAFSGTTDTYPYIYVSDGGHFENLGVYEMVVRRCRLIVVVDSTADPDFSFSDLANAIHKIRVDMGVPVLFREKPAKRVYCAVADIRYSEVDGTKREEDGILIYIKPTIRGDEPIDILQYKIKNGAFPHESTADQMYSETQFESYRGLGFHMLDTICAGQGDASAKVDDLLTLVAKANDFMRDEKARIDAENKEKLRE
ncbi:MAG: patatin-like phospholipase family protein [Pyrinomonadaceae bacterium]|nr:patatin-like phospholipase family protein [Pyrinomonadaceae bacterium]